MKCPKCVELGKKSTVRLGPVTSTCMWFEPYYDEEGVYHHHDGNGVSSGWECSNGHEGWISHSKSCPSCDWGSEETIHVDDDEALEEAG